MHVIKSLGVFALALALFAYIPGRLVLRIARVLVTPLDAVALSLSLGLVVSASIYWFLGFFSLQHYFMLLGLAAAGMFAYYCRREWSRPSIRINGPYLLLIGTILLGVVLLAMLPLYYSNLTPTEEGGMKVCPLFDAPLHVAIANELTHSIPAQNPIFSGRPLSYHVGADLPAAMFADLMGLSVADLTVRLIPTLFFIVTMLSVFCFSRLWLASDYGAVLVTFLTVFGEDFSFVPGLIQGSTSDWSAQYFGVPSPFSLFCLNPMLPALGILFAGLYCLLKSTTEQGLTWQLLAGLLFMALAECKIFTAAHLGVSLVLAGAIQVVAFRRIQMLQSTVVTGFCMAPVVIGIFLSNREGARIAAGYFHSQSLQNMVGQLGSPFQLASLWPPLSLAITLSIYLIGSLGMRIIGIPGALKELWRPRVETPLRLLLGVFVVVGVVLGLAITIVPKDFPQGYNNGVWFYVQSKYVAWLFAVDAILVMLRTPVLSRRQAAAVVAVVVAASVASTIQHFMYFHAVYRSILLPPTTVRVLEYLKVTSHPGEVVFSPEGLIGPIVATTKCHVPLGPYANDMVPMNDYRHRVADLNRFWNDWNTGQTRDDLLRNCGVNYFVTVNEKDKLPNGRAGMVRTFENTEWVVYRVK